MTIAYYDGRFLSKDELRVDPSDFGFSRGVTIFEFTRVYGGVPFRIQDHIERFAEGARSFGIELPHDHQKLESIVRELSARNKFDHSGIKFYLSIGECKHSDAPDSYGFKTNSGFTPHLMIIEGEVFPLDPEAPKGVALSERGLALKTVPFARETPDAKTTNYAPGFRAARDLAGTEFDEILYVAPDGYITETTTSNFFCVIDDVLCTPQRGMLLGVTRKVILELAKAENMPCAVRDISEAEISSISEAFLSGSFVELMPIRRINMTTFEATTEAPVFKQLRKAFSAYRTSVAPG